MKQEKNQACDACGVTAEMGYLIAEGDDIAEVIIFADNKAIALAEFNEYLLLAKQVNNNVVHDLDENEVIFFNPLNVKFTFECSAEKLIFELRSRSLLR